MNSGNTQATDTPRIEAVEVKLMDLEMSVSELNDVIIRQYQEIDALKGALARLQQQLDNLQNPQSEAAEEIPPHY